jgi:hypothetical protein
MSWYKDITSTVSGKISEIGGSIKDAASKTAGEIQKKIDPSLQRLEKSGLLKGGKRSSKSAAKKTNVNFSNRISKKVEEDWRVRISMSDSVASLFYNDTNNTLLKELSTTRGVIFPYTPQIQVTYQANYTPQKLTHTNYQTFFYDSSEVQSINITADFTVQNDEEARYVLAVIYFFRTATKMFYGQGTNVGNPPPLVYLNGYGTLYFPNVPCIVTQFTHSMPNDVDYIETATSFAQEEQSTPKSDIITRIPTISSMTITLQPVYSRKMIGEKFNLQEFSQGKLLNNNGGFI